MRHCLYDLICVGFGPAGIALATAIEDWVEARGTEKPKGVRFLERAPATTWHGGLLLPGTIINHHYLRDLATPRNPRSRFTFPNYLKEVGRLFDLGHLDGGVGRLEWSSYIRWVADQLSDYVQYNEEVVDIRPVPNSAKAEHLRVITRDGSYLTRNLVVATGSKPRIPTLYRQHLGERCFHTNEFLERVSLLAKKSRSFLVVGSGQSAAECLLYLRARFPTSTIYSLHRGVGFRLKDTGHLSNAIYYPEETDYFHNLPPRARVSALKKMFPADYGNVNHATSSALFSQMYEDKVSGQPRIIMLNRMETAEIAPQRNGRSYKLLLADIYTKRPLSLVVDVLVIATGYYEEGCPSLLANLKPYMQEESAGNIKVGRNHRIEMKENIAPWIFLCGMSERTHGISDTQSWSMMALKADVIFKTLLPMIEKGLARRREDPARSKVA